MIKRLEPKIVACQIELTTSCPLQTCAECPYPYKTRPTTSLPEEKVKMVIDQCIENWQGINFSLNGLGEPLLYAKLPEVIRYIGKRSPQSRIELFTSLVCNPEHANKIISALMEVPNKVLFAVTLHLFTRSGKRFRNMIESFLFSLVYDKINNEERIDFHINMNITKYHTPEIITHYQETFRSFLPKDHVHVTEKLDPWLGLVRNMGKEYSDVLEPSVCDYPFRVLHIGADGEILVCCTDDVFGQMSFGNIETHSLKDVWEKDDKMWWIRERHNNLDVFEVKPCNKCSRTAGYIRR